VALTLGEIIRVEDLPDEVRKAGSEAAGGTAKPLFPEKDRVVEHFERDYLISLLVENQFNVSRAAQAAGCHRRTIYRMIHRYELDLDAIRRQRQGEQRQGDKVRLAG
jgi:transcriptional regulator of acetoin/glycerol metabolism